MKYLFHLGHPAHFHLFKNIIKTLEPKGHECAILIKKKDILEDLLEKSNIPYFNLLPQGRTDSKLGIALGMVKTDLKLFQFARKYKPNAMIGTSYAISHVGKVLNIPSINVNEDDFDVVPLYSKLSYPWANNILAPTVCKTGKWEHKTIHYPGYHELAYLHPNHFKADKTIVEKYFSTEKPYFIIRFAKLTAHHDEGIKGIQSELAKQIISLLIPHGTVYITSERKLEPEFEQYRMAINPLDIHHVMAFAKLYIGDSQTMAAEAGVLGTPFIRFNDFVDRIGYLHELENKYELGFGIKSKYPKKLLETIQMLLALPNREQVFIDRRKKMLSEKINASSFLVWFIENYPQSKTLVKNIPEFWEQFK